eukprot:2825458-Prymnesium_polylepis.1
MIGVHAPCVLGWPSHIPPMPRRRAHAGAPRPHANKPPLSAVTARRMSVGVASVGGGAAPCLRSFMCSQKPHHAPKYAQIRDQRPM